MNNNIDISTIIPQCGGEQQDVEVAKAGTWR